MHLNDKMKSGFKKKEVRITISTYYKTYKFSKCTRTTIQLSVFKRETEPYP